METQKWRHHKKLVLLCSERSCCFRLLASDFPQIYKTWQRL